MTVIRRLQALWVALAGLALLTLLAWAVAVLRRPAWGLSLLGVLVVGGAVLRWLARRVRSGTVLELDLDRGVVEHVPADPLGRGFASGSFALRDVVEALDRAAVDPRVSGVIARVGTGRIGLAQVQELRDAIARFRASGKTAVAYAETFEERNGLIACYLAAAFGELHLLPTGELGAVGLLSRRPFLRPLLDRWEIVPDFDHRSEYKAAKYLFTEDHLTEPDREASSAVLASQFSQIVAGIAHDRGLTEATVRDLIDRAPLLASEALEGGLVDRLSYRDEVYGPASEKRRLLAVDRYLKRAGRPHRRGPGVALVYGVGAVHRGRGRFDPLSPGTVLASDPVAGAIRAAVANRKVRAILFRVDSPGGSAVGSDLVWREVVRAREAGKPVVVSMGNVAGSGGYFVAAGADRIVAQSGTVTGSIGVVTGKLVLGRAWRRIGVHWDHVAIGRNATVMSPDDEWTDSERERITAQLDQIYEDFKAKVAEGRGLDLDAVEEVARGRIWSGADAQERGLVDDLGGLDVALRLAKELAGIPAKQSVRLSVYPRRRLPLRAREFGESAASLRTLVEAVAPALRAAGATQPELLTTRW